MNAICMRVIGGLGAAASLLAQEPPAVAAGGAAPDIRGLHAAIPIPAALRGASATLWLVVALLSVAAVSVAWWWRRRRAVRPVRTPEQHVDAAFAAGDAAMRRGDGAEAAALLEGAVRDYLWARFALPARSGTTAEVLVLIRSASERHAALAELEPRLTRLLCACSEVVFARVPLAMAEWWEHTNVLRTLVDRATAVERGAGEVPPRSAGEAAPEVTR